MANWIECNYHGTEDQHDSQGLNKNVPINLDHVATYFGLENSIDFVIPKEENISWFFVNNETKDLELIRIGMLIHK